MKKRQLLVLLGIVYILKVVYTGLSLRIRNNGKTGMTAKSLKNSDSGISSKGKTAAYIEDLAREMEILAAREGIKHLSDLLRMAKEEAHRATLAC